MSQIQQEHYFDPLQVHLSTTNKTKWGRPIYILDHDFHYISPHSHLQICVPMGFETDLASVPVILAPLFPSAYKWSPVAVVHDYCYQTGCISRKEADYIFIREAWRAPIRMRIMYVFLRLFGFLFYHGDYNYDKNKKFDK